LNGCPVCRAAFRGSVECPRCGADLGPLMSLATRAWRLRQSARRYMAAGDLAAARASAAAAKRLHHTGAGRALLLVSQALQ
jgi:predicted amidophosphoribosyltransferase